MSNSSPPDPKPQKPPLAKRSSAQSFEDAILTANDEVKKVILTPTAAAALDASITGPYSISTMAIPGYSTLDRQHLKDIQAVIASIRLYANDRSRRRPLNFMLHAEPGSGKSHFVECLANRLSEERVKDVSFNMTSMRGADDLGAPIDRVRDLKVADRLPLLFLDEFDSNSENFARLLPLLWDGKVDVGGRLLQTGKMVVVLAGSSKRIGELSHAAKSLKDATKKEDGKLIDLLSRINGGEISIPGLDEVSETRDRRVDKVCLAVALLRQRFGGSLRRVPWALLRFIADTKFKHGSRSIATLLDLIPLTSEKTTDLKLEETRLPFGSKGELTSSSLIYHLADSTPIAIIGRWTELAKSTSLVSVADDETFVTRFFDYVRKEPSFKRAIESS